MSNLLCLYEVEEPTNQETIRFLRMLQEYSQINFKAKRCMDISSDDLKWCDIIYAIRASSRYEELLSGWAKKHGKMWISLYDDDFLLLDSSYGSSGQGYRNNRKRCIKRVLKNTDVLITSNQLLAKKYAKIGSISRIYVGDTAIDCSNMAVPSINNEKTKIVLYVNDASKDMFDQIIKPVFPKITEKLGDRISFYFIALHPDLKEFENKIELNFIPHMPFDEFLDYIGNEGFSIGLAPLVNEGFSRYKYYNKYIEYTRAGITGIYSDCDLYRRVITNGFNGILCQNTAEDWFNAINYLVENPEERVKIAVHAQEYAKDNFSKGAIAQKFIVAVPEVENLKTPKIDVSIIIVPYIRTRYRIFRAVGWAQTVIMMIRNGNIKGIVPKFKRMLNRR